MKIIDDFSLEREIATKYRSHLIAHIKQHISSVLDHYRRNTELYFVHPWKVEVYEANESYHIVYMWFQVREDITQRTILSRIIPNDSYILRILTTQMITKLTEKYLIHLIGQDLII